MIILRKGQNKEFIYTDSKNNVIEDTEILEYIKKLVIPPNYIDVTIFYSKSSIPKILFQGYDSKGRLQRIYSDMWNKKSIRKKNCQLLNFAEQIKNITDTVKKNISSTKNSKEKLVSLIIHIMMVCYFRVGNKKYQELYGSFGAMNILKKHISFNKDNTSMNISFNGKKGVFNSCDITDKTLIDEILKLTKNKDNNDTVFQYLKDGNYMPIKATDVNNWLKQFDPVITSKDFRTYDSNILLILFTRNLKKPTAYNEKERKRNIVNAMKEISEKIHNTPAILKKNYTEGGIVDMYINHPIKYSRYFYNSKTPRRAFMDYLKDLCKNYS